MRSRVKDKKLSLTVGDIDLLKNGELKNYQAGDVTVGTYNSTYGGKDLVIKSLKLRDL